MENSTLRQKIELRFASKGPCGVPDPCDEEDEYDPCGSSDDITEKDLAVLLKEEAAKLEQSKEAEKEEPKTEERIEAVEQKVEEIKQEPEPTTLEPIDQKQGKKKVCKKFIKNPFFTNRLRFSSDMPPKPPTPPPQFLPLVEEVDSSGRVKCQNQKRKKCKKRPDSGKIKQGFQKDKESEDENEIKDEGLEGDDKAGSTGGTEEDTGGTEGDTESMSEEGKQDGQGTGGVRKRKKRSESKDKKKCKKKETERPLCKKKQSEVSISLLPPQIPPLQRELPLTSPKDIPEVEKQILMACGNEEKKCKKQTNKCKAK